MLPDEHRADFLRLIERRLERAIRCPVACECEDTLRAFVQSAGMHLLRSVPNAWNVAEELVVFSADGQASSALIGLLAYGCERGLCPRLNPWTSDSGRMLLANRNLSACCLARITAAAFQRRRCIADIPVGFLEWWKGRREFFPLPAPTSTEWRLFVMPHAITSVLALAEPEDIIPHLGAGIRAHRQMSGSNGSYARRAAHRW